MSDFSSSSSNDRKPLIPLKFTAQRHLINYSWYWWFAVRRLATEAGEVVLRKTYQRANEHWSREEKEALMRRIQNACRYDHVAHDLRRLPEEVAVAVWNLSAELAEAFNVPKPESLQPPASFNTGPADRKEAQPTAPTLNTELPASSSDQRARFLSDSGSRSSKIALEDQNTGKHLADLPPLLPKPTAQSVRFQGDETVQDCAKQSGIAQEKTEAKAAVRETNNPETTAPKNTAGTTVVAPAAPATQPEAPAVAPVPSAVAPQAPTAESVLPAVSTQIPVNAPDLPASNTENPAVETITPAVTNEIPMIAPEAPTVEPEISAGESVVLATLTSPPAALEEASDQSSPPVIQVAEATSSAKHDNAMMLAIMMQLVHHSSAALVIPADFVPLSNESFVSFVQSLLYDSATPAFEHEEALSPIAAQIDPRQSKLRYVDCFAKKAHALAEKIRRAKRRGDAIPCPSNTYVPTPKGFSQKEVPPFLRYGTAASAPFGNPLRRDQILLRHGLLQFPWWMTDLADRSRLIDEHCASSGIDRKQAFVSIHRTKGAYYEEHDNAPTADHCHIAFMACYGDIFRQLNSVRHVGARLTLAAYDVLAGNIFRVPRYNLASCDSVLANSYQLNYRFLGKNTAARYSLPELRALGIDPNDLDESGVPKSHDLFDENWLSRVLPPDDFIKRYSFSGGSRSFSEAILRTFPGGGKTQKAKIQADLNAADRFQAASKTLTDRPLKQLKLPQHLLRRGADLKMADHPNIDDCRRFMEDCLGVHADPETKAATLLLLAGGLRQGKAESLRCVRYWTGQ